jgi:hypothetical protein
LDPYALESILENWSLTSKQLKILIVIKVTVGLYAFYYLGLLLFHLFFRSPLCDYGVCEVRSATEGTEGAHDRHATLVLGLNTEMIELDHKMRGKKGFVGEVQIFSKVHAMGDGAEIQAVTRSGEEINNVGPIGTLTLDGIVAEGAGDATELTELSAPLKETQGKVLWFPHRGGENDHDYGKDQEALLLREKNEDGEILREKFSVEVKYTLTRAGQLTVELPEVNDGQFYQWPFGAENCDSFEWVVKNEGRFSPFSSWAALMPLMVLFDETLLFGEVVHLGNGRNNPYNGKVATVYT